MDITRLLSNDNSSPLDQIEASANPSAPARSPDLAPQPLSDREHSDSDVEDPPAAIPASVDPHVAGFLKSVLGSRKWRIFSSKLCERKDKDAAGSSARTRGNEAGGSGAQKQRPRTFSSASFPEQEDGVLHGGTSPCAIAFLVKVEVVKEVLRNYVPNPYHPTKAESHRYSPAPGGVVHVTRASVLALCQWSNTQFAYWSRRSEAVSVLAGHDSGLRDLFFVLYQRLYQKDPPSHAFVSSAPSSSASWSSAASSSGSPPPAAHQPLPSPHTHARPVFSRTDAAETERRLRVARSFTGKGLDGVITQVKRRTGASQFLRGRQSSLDPFGAYLESGIAAYDPNWPIVMPSVHGRQTHSRNSSDSYDFIVPQILTPGSRPRSNSLMGSPMYHRRTIDGGATSYTGGYDFMRSPDIMPISNDSTGSLRSLRGSERNNTPPSRASTAHRGHTSSASSSPASIDTRSSSHRSLYKDTYSDGSTYALSNDRARSRGHSGTTHYSPYLPGLKRTKSER